MHVLLDGIDGPLARHLGVASPRGSLTDSFVDQIVVTATTITVMSACPEQLSVWAGGTYIFAYTLVMAFAMVRNALKVPYSWVVRPRFFVYLAMLVEFTVYPNILEWMVSSDCSSSHRELRESCLSRCMFLPYTNAKTTQLRTMFPKDACNGKMGAVGVFLVGASDLRPFHILDGSHNIQAHHLHYNSYRPPLT